MPKLDLRVYKKDFRAEVKAFRQAMPPEQKQKKDEKILQRVLSLRQMKSAKTLLCYVSTPIEVDTRMLLQKALDQGLQVAVPMCIDGTRQMDFYVIQSLTEDLAPRTFGVLEPILERCKKLTDFSNSICIVPALIYDLSGYRLGYGGGYYDRFLSQYQGFKVGIIYNENIRKRIQHGRYDVPVDLIVTDRSIRGVKKQQQVRKAQETHVSAPKEQLAPKPPHKPRRRRPKRVRGDKQPQ